MAIKTKIIGLVLVILGAWPFLLKIDAIGTFFSSYKFLEVLTPGELVYQIVIIIFGVLLIWTVKPRIETR